MKTFVTVLFSSLLLAGPALADSVTITGGFTTMGRSNFGTVHLLGEGGFQFDGVISDAGGLLVCQICKPGALTPIFGSDFVSIPGDMNHGAAQVVFDGTTFSFPSGFNGSNSQGFLRYSFSAFLPA